MEDQGNGLYSRSRQPRGNDIDETMNHPKSRFGRPTVPAAVELVSELNAIFDACQPNEDDEVDRSCLLNALVDKYNRVSDNTEDEQKLRSTFETVLNPDLHSVAREAFLKLMMGHANVNHVLPPTLGLLRRGRVTQVNRTVVQLRRENSTLNDQLAAQNHRIQALEDVQKRLNQDLQNAYKRIQDLEKQCEEKDEKIGDLKYSLSAQDSKRIELLDELKKAEQRLQEELERQALLENQVKEKKNTVEQLMEDKLQFMNRINRLSAEKQELQRRVNAQNEARRSKLVETGGEPSPNMEGPNIAQELNMCSRYQSQGTETRDVATDVKGLASTAQAATSVRVSTGDVATSVEGLARPEAQDTAMITIGTQATVQMGDNFSQTCTLKVRANFTQTSTLMVRDQSTEMCAQDNGRFTPFTGNGRTSRETVSRIPNWMLALLLAFTVYAWVTFALGITDVVLYFKRLYQHYNYTRWVGMRGPPPS